MRMAAELQAASDCIRFDWAPAEASKAQQLMPMRCAEQRIPA